MEWIDAGAFDPIEEGQYLLFVLRETDEYGGGELPAFERAYWDAKQGRFRSEEVETMEVWGRITHWMLLEYPQDAVSQKVD